MVPRLSGSLNRVHRNGTVREAKLSAECVTARLTRPQIRFGARDQ